MFVDFGLLLYYLAWIAVLILYFALYLGIIKICSIWKLSLATIVKVTCAFIILFTLSCLAFSLSDTAIGENYGLLIFKRYVLPIVAALVMFVVLKRFSNYERPENKKYEQDNDGRMIIQPERYLALKGLWKDLAKSAQIANLFLIALSLFSSVLSLLPREIVPPELIHSFALMDFVSAVVSAVLLYQQSKKNTNGN